jgi:hypothetical protein
MPSPNASDTVAAVHLVKTEIDTLAELQMEALKRATCIGMTPEEAKEYDKRHKKIVHLVQELTLLEPAQEMRQNRKACIDRFPQHTLE